MYFVEYERRCGQGLRKTAHSRYLEYIYRLYGKTEGSTDTSAAPTSSSVVQQPGKKTLPVSPEVVMPDEKQGSLYLCQIAVVKSV